MAMTDNNPDNRIIDEVDDDEAFVPSADSGHEVDGDSDTAEGADSPESVGLNPSWRRIDEIVTDQSGQTPQSAPSPADDAVTDWEPKSDTVGATQVSESASAASPLDTDDAATVTESDSADSFSTSDDADNESEVVPPQAEEPSDADETHPDDEGETDSEADAETPQAEELTYTTAIQRITSAMATGQLAQKLRARLVKHSRDVADEREELLPPPPPLPEEASEEADTSEAESASSPESVDESTIDVDAPVASTGDVLGDEAEESIEDAASEPAAKIDEELEPVATSPAETEIWSADSPTDLEETEVEPDGDETKIVYPPLPVTPSAPVAPADLPPLKPVASVEPQRIKVTRSGNKILALPAGTQVLRNSLRSVRTTIDTLNSGGRIDPTRPTIAIFVVGMVIAALLSIATLKGTFDFGSDTFTPDAAPTPVVSSPEAIPEESEAPEENTESEAPAPKPVIEQIQVISYNDDDGDHQELADRMLDDDTSTNWQSRYFNTADLPEGNTVRLVITLAEAAPVSEVIFTGAISGGQVDLRVNDGSDPFGGAALTSSEMSQTTTLKPSEPVTGNTVTLNFVSLPTDDEGVNRVKITELQVR